MIFKFKLPSDNLHFAFCHLQFSISFLHAAADFLFHSLDLARQIEEGFIQTEVHSANIKVDTFALFPLDPYLKLGTRLYEVEK